MAPEGFPQLTVISNIVEDGRPVGLSDAGLLWHTDTCFTAQPELFVSLSAHVIPTAPDRSLGDTIWISTAAAYDALPAEEQRRLAGLRAVQSYAFHLEKMARLSLLTRAPLTAEQRAQFPEVDHPVVRTHPITGRRLLYVNESFSSRIPGLDPDEGTALLEALWAHLLDPAFAFRHRWRGATSWSGTTPPPSTTPPSTTATRPASCTASAPAAPSRSDRRRPGPDHSARRCGKGASCSTPRGSRAGSEAALRLGPEHGRCRVRHHRAPEQEPPR